MREIILDTETTGLDPAQGHRIVEIGGIELVNHIPSGRTFHVYLDPQRDMPAEAEEVHGLTTQFLRGKPLFADVIDDFLTFIADAALVIHNASFDAQFINAELVRLDMPEILPERLIDTLLLARTRHPMGPNSLDALCKRYGIDNARREKHGALLDAELLADVYIELIGGRQAALMLATVSEASSAALQAAHRGLRPRPLIRLLTSEEEQAHAAMIAELGPKALWLSIAM